MATSNRKTLLALLKGYENMLIALAAVLTATAALLPAISRAVSTAICEDVPTITPSSSTADSLISSRSVPQATVNPSTSRKFLVIFGPLEVIGSVGPVERVRRTLPNIRLRSQDQRIALLMGLSILLHFYG